MRNQVWQYENVHSIPEIDLCEVHDYSHESMPGDQWNGMQVRIDQCAALNKPIFVGESGIIPNTIPGGTFADRSEMFDAKFRAQFAAGMQGELVWAYRRTGSTLNTYDIGDGDPVLLRLQAWSPGCDPNDYRIAYTKEPPRGGAGSPTCTCSIPPPEPNGESRSTSTMLSGRSPGRPTDGAWPTWAQRAQAIGLSSAR